MSKTALFSRRTVGGVNSIESQDISTGDRFYVDSTSSTNGDTDGYGSSPDAPYATLNACNNNSTASKGDIIYVMPGHAETIATATALALDVAGVKVKGLGWGNMIPTFTLSAAASIVTISAANVWLENVKIISEFTTGVATGISITTAGNGCTIHKVQMRETTAAKEFKTNWIAVAAAVTDLTITDCNFHGVIAGTDVNCILFAGATTNLYMENNRFFGDFSGNVVEHAAGVALNAQILSNRIVNMDTGAAGYSLYFKTASTGYAFDNYGFANKNDAPVFLGDAMYWDQNSAGNTLANSGILPHPAAVAAMP